jgi:hypothetical protein
MFNTQPVFDEDMDDSIVEYMAYLYQVSITQRALRVFRPSKPKDSMTELSDNFVFMLSKYL